MQTFASGQHVQSSYRQCLVNSIVKAVKPEMIFLLGAALYHRSSKSIFQTLSVGSQYMSDYIVLVLLENLANKEAHEWQDKIENQGMPVTSIVLTMCTFNEWLQLGHRFAVKVQQSAEILYDSGNQQLQFSHTAIPNDEQHIIEKHWREGMIKAKEFLAGSELYKIRKQYAMATFMLHQSAEQSLHTILKMGTGYHANTHNIDRLLRYAGLVSDQLTNIFPQKTEADKQLFQLLQKAYSDARYKSDYTISYDQLLCLTEKVRCMHEVLSSYKRVKLNSHTINHA
ncbi:MAG: HEPN domain-containing protein [Chitinophagaceae bacterium]|nr:HEPN domain-containing protein [Chitinophagaceae bacterium]